MFQRHLESDLKADFLSSSSSSLFFCSSLVLACVTAFSSPCRTSFSQESSSTCAIRSFFTTFNAFLEKHKHVGRIKHKTAARHHPPTCLKTVMCSSCRLFEGVLTWSPAAGHFLGSDVQLPVPYLKFKKIKICKRN